MLEKYGAWVQESNVSTHPESNPSTQPKHSTKQSAPSGNSQKVSVVKEELKWGLRKGKQILRDEDSEDSAIPDANKVDASIPDGSTNPDGTTIPDASVTPDATNVIIVMKTFHLQLNQERKVLTAAGKRFKE